MSKITDLHDQAMELSDQAIIAGRSGNAELVEELTKQSFNLEKQAAESLLNRFDAEPTRSILFRSAASLAVEIGELREAERLAAIGLAGSPPEELAEELRVLMEEVQFRIHLRNRQIEIKPNSFELAIEGEEVGYGVALSDVFIDRVKDFERLMFRTIERIAGAPFRERGSANSEIQQGYSLYLSAPRAGSFVVSLQVGRQLQLPGMDRTNEVVNEILECFRLLNDGNQSALHEKIPQELYYQNFVALAKRIAPDGKKVRHVTLSGVRAEQPIEVTLTKVQSDISLVSVKQKSGDESTFEKVTGRLLYADALASKNKIKLQGDDGKTYAVVVPESLMDDIVRPLWHDRVVVSGVRKGRALHLQDITSMPEESD